MIIILTLILFTVGVMVVAATSDFLKLRIPNILPLLIILAFGAAYSLDTIMGANIFDGLKTHLIAGGILFIVMTILFFLNMFGGGDAKLIPAVALWVGLGGLPTFLMITTIAGGGLAILSIILRKTKLGNKAITSLAKHPKLQNGWIGALKKEKNVVPYGIAIAIGGVVAFQSVGLLP